VSRSVDGLIIHDLITLAHRSAITVAGIDGNSPNRPRIAGSTASTSDPVPAVDGAAAHPTAMLPVSPFISPPRTTTTVSSGGSSSRATIGLTPQPHSACP
jgi:hypothetical protein